MRNRILAALIAGLFLAIPFTVSAGAHEYKLGDLEIVHPWARASAGNAKNGAAYMTIENRSGTADRLLSASSPIAKMVELHAHVMENDVMQMRPVDAVDLAPGETTKLAPGGLHVMMMGLQETLVEDSTFPLTLHFEQAGEITVDVVVEAVGAMEGEHDGMDMDGSSSN